MGCSISKAQHVTVGSEKLILFLVLNGNFSESVILQALKMIPKAKLVVFFSSTFTDTFAERDDLMSELLQIIQKRVALLGIEVTFVDMRFGIKDENTKGHLTWAACRDQILYCYEQSSGLFFVSLQGRKYGYCPLPKEIDQKVLDEKLETVSPDEREIILKWYILDKSARPTMKYQLKNLEDVNDKEFWGKDFPTISKSLDGLQIDSFCRIGHR
jgi:Domain of unknown function (DUF4062)